MKHNAKKIAAVLLAALALSLASCSVSTGYEGGKVKEPSDVTVDGKSVKDDGEKATENPDGKTEKETAEVTIEETVLLDEADVKITAKKLEDGFLGPKLKLLIENNSGKNLTFQDRGTSVNGYMIDALLSADVASGKKTNDEITFSQSALDICGIKTIADMEISFHIYDDDWETYLDSAPIVLKTSAADGYTYVFDDSGSAAYDAGGIKIVIKGLSDEDSLLGKEIVVYIDNESGRNITVQNRDLSVNGFMNGASFSCDVSAGKHAVDTITLFSSDLEENEIENIENVELSFHIFDADSWDTIADSDTVTVNF